MWDLKIFNFDLYFLFYNFFLYCFFGWIYESCFVSIKKKTWVNRGFLNGPIIPIYGAGATIVYIFIAPFHDSAVLVFVVGFIIATLLEFVTSYVMEKLFHAKWWDYTHYKYNIKGRICLTASLFWGFLSILMSEVLQPFMNSLIDRIPRQTGESVGVIIVVLFTADVTITVIYTLQLDKKLSELIKIRDEFAEYLESTRLFGMKEELRSRFEGMSISNLWDYMKEQLDEKFEMSEELEQKVRNFTSRYQNMAELKNIIHKRIVKAFPTMKSTRSERIMDSLRKKRKKNDE